MNILSPTSITSNKVCIVLGAQQLVGLAMLYKVISLIATRALYLQAHVEKKRVENRFDNTIALEEKQLQNEVAVLDTYKQQLSLVESPELKEVVRENIAIQLQKVVRQVGVVAEKRSAKNAALAIEDRKFAAAEAEYQKDKEYLKIAFQRMVPLWGSYISYCKVKELKKAAPAA